MSKEKYDNSMLSEFVTCPRKYFFKYENNRRRTGRGGALEFGQGIHSACDCFFQGKDVDDAIEAFRKDVPEDLDEKRTVECGETIIKEYYKNYKDQPINEVLAVEGMYMHDFGDFEFWGKIDKVVKWQPGISPIDHKTTSWYLSQFGDSVKPNWQFTGYLYLCREAFEGVYGLIADGIYVPSPPLRRRDGSLKTDFLRVTTTRSQLDFDEWKIWVIDTVDDIRTSRDASVWHKNPQSCMNFNRRCGFKDICEVPIPLGEALAEIKASSEYEESKWEPWKED